MAVPCRIAPVLLVLAASASLGLNTAAAQAEPVTVQWSPTPAVEGRALVLRVVPRPGTVLSAVDGIMSEEPLHFAPVAGGLEALAAVPIGAANSVRLELHLRVVGEAEVRAVTLAIPVASGQFSSERLTVEPRFAQPDSATAARIAAEVAQARAVARRAHDTPRLWREPFRLPRASRMTGAFGRYRTFNGVVQSRHMGTDFAGAVGAPVVAANRGVVALVAEFYLAGTAVYLDHGAGLVTGYFHLSRALVAEGDTVSAGQRIGLVGRSGRVTGPHLHWIARFGGITLDPTSLVGVGRVDDAGR